MSPLILRPELHRPNVLHYRKMDPAWLSQIQIRCRAAQDYLAAEKRQPQEAPKEIRTLVNEDIPTLIRELKDPE